MNIRALLPLAAMGFLAACNTSHSCISGSAFGMLDFEGYDSATLEEVVVTHYNSLNQMIDTAVYRLSASDHPLVHSDANPNEVYWPIAIKVRPGENVGVTVVSTGRVYRITGLEQTHASVKQSFMGNDEVCYDVITGYYLDGKFYSTGLSDKDTYNGAYAPITMRP